MRYIINTCDTPFTLLGSHFNYWSPEPEVFQNAARVFIHSPEYRNQSVDGERDYVTTAQALAASVNN
jgi:hypothetical protein